MGKRHATKTKSHYLTNELQALQYRGNSTRTMTTAIALETSKGEFAFGLALGMLLLSVALLVNLFLNVLQQR